MSDIVQSFADPALPAAIEKNFAQEMAIWGQVLPTSNLHEDRELLWFVSGKPTFNGVPLTRFVDADRELIHARISSLIDFFKARKFSFGWSVGPSTVPADLASYLLAHDFHFRTETTGLAADIRAIHEDSIPVTGLRIVEIERRETMELKRKIEQEGFGTSDEIAQNYNDGYCAAGFGGENCWHHYLGWLHDEPVAIASLLLYAGIAGIYGVATLPHVRRQGLGTTMTQHALQMAFASGYRIAALTDTVMSKGIYQRMGFRIACKIQHYEWSLTS